jgi:hypothetical protein
MHCFGFQWSVLFMEAIYLLKNKYAMHCINMRGTTHSGVSQLRHADKPPEILWDRTQCDLEHMWPTPQSLKCPIYTPQNVRPLC